MIEMETPRPMEYSKDRLNHQIRELMRENSILKNSLYNKDREVLALQEKFRDADSTVSFLSGSLAVVLIAVIVCTIVAVKTFMGSDAP